MPQALKTSQWGVYALSGTPVTVTSGASTARVAIPTTADGNTARFVRVVSNGSAYVMPGNSSVTVAAGAGVMVNGTGDFVLYVRGNTHIAYIQEAAGSKINITPLEV